MKNIWDSKLIRGQNKIFIFRQRYKKNAIWKINIFGFFGDSVGIWYAEIENYPILLPIGAIPLSNPLMSRHIWREKQID